MISDRFSELFIQRTIRFLALYQMQEGFVDMPVNCCILHVFYHIGSGFEFAANINSQNCMLLNDDMK